MGKTCLPMRLDGTLKVPQHRPYVDHSNAQSAHIQQPDESSIHQATVFDAGLFNPWQTLNLGSDTFILRHEGSRRAYRASIA